MKTIFLIVFISLAVTACGFQHEKQRGPAAVAGTSRGLGRPVAYAEVFQAVIAPRCLACHSAGGGNQGGVNLETLETVLAQVRQIERTALIDRTMPKGQALSEAETTLLAAWVTQVTRPGSGAERPAITANWIEVKEKIFTLKCLDCHSGNKPEGGLDLASLTDARAAIGKVFQRAVIDQDMPLAPYEPLSIEEKRALAEWLFLGMPE